MPEKTTTLERNERIWQAVRDIPRGQVASYGQIAAIAGIPRGARQVGYALRQLPPGHAVPWYRVITASGQIAFEKGSRPHREQVRRLRQDGVTVVGGRVDMRQYRWQPDLDELLWKPSAAWDTH
jgi:methylated-DNA-protein-cysteine methyltransferase-like protein